MLKCSRDRWVCAPQYLSAGTSISPIESLSMRASVFSSCRSLASGDMVLPSVLLCPADEVDLRAQCCVEFSWASTRTILHQGKPALNLSWAWPASDLEAES